MFVALTHRVLNELKGRGYQVLTSVSAWDDDKSPIFWPEKVEGPVGEFILALEFAGKLTGEEHFLVIEEALTIEEDYLIGVVWMEN